MEVCYNILLIEDHPIIQSAYKDGFNTYANKHKGVEFCIDIVDNCDEAIKFIKQYSQAKKELEIVFLDIRIPSSKDSKYLSGEDVGVKIKELLPKTKIVIATSLNNNYRVHSIFKSINPDGFIIKNDFDAQGILNTIKNVLSNEPYYSKSVLKFLRNHISTDLLLDATDRRILYELSIGTKTKELPKLVPLSLGGVEKRKRHLKEIFNSNSNDDRELILRAKEQGFL